MLHKTEKHQYFFEVELNWQKGREGMIHAKDVNDSISVATAHEFIGGIPGKWSPEHLFIGSLCSSFMTIFLAFAEKKELKLVYFECSAIGRIQLLEGHLEFTGIDLYPKVGVSITEDVSGVKEIVKKTHEHCIIANSIRAPIIFHEEIKVKNQS
jgi:organic hydroperoxide reductase OsmC/OhrA